MLTGRRYGGGDALEAGIVSHALPRMSSSRSHRVGQVAVRQGGPTLRTIRTTMYRHVIDQLGPGTVLQLPV